MNIQKINKIDLKEKDMRDLISSLFNKLFSKKKIKKVLLINPPDADNEIFNYDIAKRGRYWNFPPYGLGLIASHLKEINIKVNIINLNNEILKQCCLSNKKQEFNFDNIWKIKLLNIINDFNPDIIAVTCMFSQTHKAVLDICNYIKEMDIKYPLALGGVHITNSLIDLNSAEILFNDFKQVDLFFLYEAEIAFKKFIQIVNKKEDLEELHQVYFRNGNTKLFFIEKEIPNNNDLNIIPSYDLMKVNELVESGVIGSFFCFKEKGTKIATILSNRGCRGQCAFCSVRNFNGKGVRRRHFQSVIDEIFLLKEKYDVKHIMWLDDDLFYDNKKTIELFNEMIKQNVDITWDCTNGVIASSCTDEIINSAEKSGCIGLTIGVESGNAEILKKIEKPGNINIFLKASKVLRKYEKINSRVFLMIGFPNETYQMILDTFNLALKMDLDWYNITIFEPLPNTLLYKEIINSEKFDFRKVRYNSGPYGKKMQNLEENNFKDFVFFKKDNLDKVPLKSELDELWFYMNFNLNFKRLFKETRILKLYQALKYLTNIVNLVAPEDPFPIYFCLYLQKKLLKTMDLSLIKKLEKILNEKEELNSKFKRYSLSIKELYL